MSKPNDFVIENGVLTKYVGSGGDVVIPQGIVQIDAFAFSGASVSTLVLPDTLEIIGSYAFSGQTKLKEVVIPHSVKTICTHAFADCESLEQVVFGNCIEGIWDCAFRGCALTSITIPASVKKIGKDAFLRCNHILSAGPIGSGCDYEFPWMDTIPDNAFSGLRKLKKAVLPASVRKVGGNVFKDCRELADLTMPKGAKVSKTAFKGCNALGEIKEPSTESPAAIEPAVAEPDVKKETDRPEFLIVNGRLEQYNGNDQNVTVPDNVKIIGSRAFHGNGTIVEVTLPASVETVEQNAFESCPSLAAIRFLGTVKSVGANAFGFLNLSVKAALELFVYSSIPISTFTKAAQEMALQTFFRRFSEFDPNTEVFRNNLRFLGTHLKQAQKYGGQFWSYLVSSEALRHAVLEADAIPAKDLKWLIPAVQEAGHTDITAELLNYQNRLLSDDKVRKALKKSEARAEQKTLSIELPAAEWRKRLKISYEDDYAIIKGIKLREEIVTIPGHIGSKKVRVINEQAFLVRPERGEKKAWSPKTIVISEGVEEIRSFAFDSTEKAEIFFPESVSELPEACFIGVKDLTLHLPAAIRFLPEELVRHSRRPFKAIHAPAGSYAEQYAKEHGIPFVSEE